MGREVFMAASLHYSIPLFFEDPGVLAPAALGRIDDDRTFAERDPGEAAGNDRDFFSVKNEWPEIDVPALHAVVAE
jgi:hypothetical protein